MTPQERRVLRQLREDLAETQKKLNQSELLQMKCLLKIKELEAKVAEGKK